MGMLERPVGSIPLTHFIAEETEPQRTNVTWVNPRGCERQSESGAQVPERPLHTSTGSLQMVLSLVGWVAQLVLSGSGRVLRGGCPASRCRRLFIQLF